MASLETQNGFHQPDYPYHFIEQKPSNITSPEALEETVQYAIDKLITWYFCREQPTAEVQDLAVQLLKESNEEFKEIVDSARELHVALQLTIGDKAIDSYSYPKGIYSSSPAEMSTLEPERQLLLHRTFKGGECFIGDDLNFIPLSSLAQTLLEGGQLELSDTPLN
jgi:hypothetical protein